jgi:hypothetical protein
MKMMIKVSLLIVSFLLVLCAKVEPKNELIGRWAWTGHSCYNWFGVITPANTRKILQISFEKESVSFYSKDTLLHTCNYTIDIKEKKCSIN